MAATSESSDSLRFRVSKLGGEEQDVQVERNCSLGEFKSMLVGRGLAKEGLAVDFIAEGVLMNLSRSGTTIGELNLAEDSHLVVITRRSHDYGQIREVQCMVKSHQWPQGVLTTTEGHLYVCHWGGQLQVYDLELKLLRETVLKSPPVVHPSQMAMAPNGELLMACYDGSAAVVDSGTLELVRMIPTTQRNKSTGLAIQEEELFVSHLGSGQIDVFNLQTGQHLRNLDGFTGPSGLCTFDGGLLVADRGANAVWLVDHEGNRTKIGEGELKHPNDVAVDLSGNILVMDTGNERIAAFRPDGSLMCSILPGTFTDFGNTHSYISVNPVNGAISVSMDDAHHVAILAPPIQSD
ncbi:Trim2 [Symbiodinium sp. CCMP2592]|nr:Trim2 [Symbiodinium sp. CCMP2592]